MGRTASGSRGLVGPRESSSWCAHSVPYFCHAIEIYKESRKRRCGTLRAAATREGDTGTSISLLNGFVILYPDYDEE